MTWAFSRSRSRRTKTAARYSWQEARAHDRTNGYCRARKAGGDSLNLALHTAAFDGNPSNRSRGGAEATRALHHTRDERVGNRISEKQRRDEQRGQIMASCTMFSAARREDSNLRMAESKSRRFALFVRAYSEKVRRSDLNPIKRLAGISECRIHIA